MNSHFNVKLQRIKAELLDLRDEVRGERDTDNHFLLADLENNISQAVNHVVEALSDYRDFDLCQTLVGK